jgi:LacI family transcriptional regulator
VLASPAHRVRVDGLRRAFAEDGIDIPDNAVFMAAEPTPRGGHGAATAALTGAGRPTALFATHDTLALGALEAARALGLSVPGDLSLVGHDDNPEVQLTSPALTSVALPKRQMARQAVELLLRGVTKSGTTVNSVQLLRPELIVRDSTGPAPAPAHR